MPLVTINDFWGQNVTAYVGQWYHMCMHAKNRFTECIFQFWPPFDLQWSLVTSYDFWSQTFTAYVGQGYHMRMHAKNGVTGWTFQFWPLFDLQWPLVTSYDFWGQNAIDNISQGYNMRIMPQLCPLVHFSNLTSFWLPVTSSDLLWLHITYWSGIQ